MKDAVYRELGKAQNGAQLSQLPNCEETKCARGQTLWFSSYLWIITAGWSSGRLVTLTW